MIKLQVGFEWALYPSAPNMSRSDENLRRRGRGSKTVTEDKRNINIPPAEVAVDGGPHIPPWPDERDIDTNLTHQYQEGIDLALRVLATNIDIATRAGALSVNSQHELAERLNRMVTRLKALDDRDHDIDDRRGLGSTLTDSNLVMAPMLPPNAYAAPVIPGSSVSGPNKIIVQKLHSVTNVVQHDSVGVSFHFNIEFNDPTSHLFPLPFFFFLEKNI
ncbi:hypothetical protein CVT24_010047 [Panaeolus cyanescens]|uniref:Uncharacterized protein n=1 Tax=Panaeolus cyanescens TaxID=181874 RepID=A0A409X2W5_9AGAR|nr:hypothetical protein CVT24_010047 [Panaeolus cyanescens]